MSSAKKKFSIATCTHFVHQNLLACLLAMYALAVFMPGPGIALRNVSLLAHPDLPLPKVLLAYLLFCAGFGIPASGLRDALRNARLLGLGVVGNWLAPMLFLGLFVGIVRPWIAPEQMQTVVIGLALIMSMPIAGSSTTWAQIGGGDLSLSLGLVVASTMISPLTTYFSLHYAALFTSGSYRDILLHVSDTQAGNFLLLTVALPSALGILSRSLAGTRRAAEFLPGMKFLSMLSLLTLNYSHAALSLPQVFSGGPSAAYSIFIFLSSAAFSAYGFFAGYLLARTQKAGRAQRASLMFGLGMNNNGSSLVLAAATFTGMPTVLLPIIFFNLQQQIVAAVLDRTERRRASRASRHLPRAAAVVAVPAKVGKKLLAAEKRSAMARGPENPRGPEARV